MSKNDYDLDSLISDNIIKLTNAQLCVAPDQTKIEGLKDYVSELVGQTTQQPVNQENAAEWSQG